MFVRVAALVLVFIIRLRFPGGKSIAEVLRERYGDVGLKTSRRFEKIDFKLRKAKLDLVFLETCDVNGYIPRFLFFKLSNRDLQTSSAYRTCQKKLLTAEMNVKKSRIRHLEKEFELVKESLRKTLSFIDFTHVCCLMLSQNDKELQQSSEVQTRKLFNMGIDVSEQQNDPEKVIFNYSSETLNEDEKSLLAK